MQTEKYSKSRNHETWLTKIWLDDNYYAYKCIRRINSDELATAIREYIEESNPLIDRGISLFSDLLSYAINQIDFDEIARHYFE